MGWLNESFLRYKSMGTQCIDLYYKSTLSQPAGGRQDQIEISYSTEHLCIFLNDTFKYLSKQIEI